MPGLKLEVVSNGQSSWHAGQSDLSETHFTTLKGGGVRD